MLNNYVVVGRLTKDPELRKSNNDTSICNLSLAIDNTIKNEDGTRGTLFLEAKAFNLKADNIVKYCRKGSKVAIVGSLNQRNFLKNDGSKGKAIELYIDNIDFLDPKPSEPVEDNPLDKVDLPDDDLPFNQEETKPQEKVKDNEEPQWKFDPVTGKPLKPKAKN